MKILAKRIRPQNKFYLNFDNSFSEAAAWVSNDLGNPSGGVGLCNW
jgi:hypothetical protein